jgi:PIN domain nuclease of toxin-antitoxin system
MPVYIADTHAVWWYLSGSPRLSQIAQRIFDDAVAGTSQVYVPAIAIAELILLMEKRHAVIDASVILAALRAKPGFQLTALTPEIALRIQALTALPDIHDRLLVAEALEASAPLITNDQLITASGLVTVVW